LIPVEELTEKSIEEIGNKFNTIQELLSLTPHPLFLATPSFIPFPSEED
jgi:hypothetical protein